MKILLVRSTDGDWEGIYVNGKLMYQHHSLRTRDVLEALDIEFEQREVEMDPFEFSSLPLNSWALP